VEFETVIGLEIHAQLNTTSKIFCGCESSFGGEPNTRVCPVCLGLPGTLPALNRQVVEKTILTGLAMSCTIAEKSIFDRKNYFYADLPKGYQISQYELPICRNGHITIHTGTTSKTIGITRVHIEEDPGKMIHDQDIDSLLDYNRCGTPLIEIVSEPDMRSAEEACAYGQAVKQILEYMGVCDCNLERGNMRFDVNLSIRQIGQDTLGTRTEVKNLNSFRALQKAIEYESRRQVEVVSSGESVVQETLEWDAQKNVTYTLRSKEDAHDYRYFPEPDLVPLLVDQSWVEKVKKTMPELPQERFERFISQYGLSSDHARVLTDARPVADYFEETVEKNADPRMTANWVMGEVLRICKEKKVEVTALRVTPKRLGELLQLVNDGDISAIAAKKILSRIEEDDKEPAALVDEMGLRQISDSGALEQTVKAIISRFPDEVTRFKAGEKKLMAFFMGQAMKATKGKGNPKEIRTLFSKLLV